MPEPIFDLKAKVSIGGREEPFTEVELEIVDGGFAQITGSVDGIQAQFTVKLRNLVDALKSLSAPDKEALKLSGNKTD